MYKIYKYKKEPKNKTKIQLVLFKLFELLLLLKNEF